MSLKPVVFYGAGHLGRQVHHHFHHHAGAGFDALGFVDDSRAAGEPVIEGLRTLGPLRQAADSDRYGPHAVDVVFTIGYANMALRLAALERVLAAGYRLRGFVHPRAWVEPSATVGQGCVVLAGAVVDQHVTVGDACFLDIGVRLTAGTTIGRNNYLSSGTSTGSRVHIGDSCFFGMDCTITTDVRLGSRLVVNAKTLVPRDAGDNLKLVELHKSRALPLPP